MPIDGDRIPTDRSKIRVSILALGDLCHRVKSHIITIVYQDEVIQTTVTRKRNGLTGNPLLHATVSCKSDHVMVKERVPGRIKSSCGSLPAQSISNRVSYALTQGPSRRLYPGSFLILGVARRNAVKFSEILHRLKRKIISGKVQPTVKEHRSMACGENESVPIKPAGSRWIIPHGLTEKNCSDFGASQRESKVPGRTRMHRIDRQPPGLLGGLGQRSTRLVQYLLAHGWRRIGEPDEGCKA